MALPMRALAHVGVSVPDIEAAVAWYGEVFGFDPIMDVHEIDLTGAAAENNFVAMCTQIFGERFKRVKVAHLATANGAAVELFQFLDPAYEAPHDNFAYWRGGIFHLSVVAADVEAQVERLTAAGGVQRTEICASFENRPYRACYCEDPWGTIIEIVSHSHERMLSNVS